MTKRFQLGPEIERYTQLLARDPDSLAFVPLADAYRKSGLFEEAFAVLKRGMGRRPEYIPAKIVLGKCYLDLGNYPKAQTTFEDILTIDRDNLVALSSVANVRLHQRRYGEAATVYRRILELDPSNDNANQQLAKLEGKSPSPTRDEVIEIDIESTATQTHAGDPDSEELEEKTSDTIDFENLMRSGEVPPQKGEKVTAEGSTGIAETNDTAQGKPREETSETKRPAHPASPKTDGGSMERKVEETGVDGDVPTTGSPDAKDAGNPPAAVDGDTEVDLDVIPPSSGLDIVKEEREVRPDPVDSSEEAKVKPDASLEELAKSEEVPRVKQTGEEPEIDVEVPVPPPPDTGELEVVEPETVEVMPEDEIPPEIPPVKDTAPVLPTTEEEKPAFRTFSSWLSGLSGRKNKKGREEGEDEEPRSG